jgi:hypothetical protein
MAERLVLKRPVKPRTAEDYPRDYSTFGTGIPASRKGRKAPEIQPRKAPETPRRAPDGLPAEWNVPHVFDRLVEAVETLGRVPMTVRPRGHANGLPTGTQDKLSLLEQLELEESGELERLHLAQNRVRLPVTSLQISRMEQALNWPLEYLADMPEVAKAVGLAALWTVQRSDIAQRCRHRGMSVKTFHRRQIHGLTIIAQRLAEAGVPVS